MTPLHCTEVRFASFLSGGFTTMVVINPSDWKLANCTSVHCVNGLLIKGSSWNGICTVHLILI